MLEGALDVDQIVRDLTPLADWWANRIQWSEEHHEDLVQEGLLSLVVTLRGYQKSGLEIRDVKGLASACFRGAMQWWYKKSDRTLNFVSFEEVKISVAEEDHHLESVVVGQFLDSLESTHGTLARRVVEHLLAPGEEIAEVAMATMKSKQEARSRGERVIGYGTPRFHKHHVQTVVGLNATEWEATMANIKTFARGYFQWHASERKSSKASVRRPSPPSLPSPTHESTTPSLLPA